MNTPAQPEPVAVVCERGGDDAANVERYLQAAGLANAAWYAPCDADDADRALRAGQVQRAIFPTVPALLAALWDGSITVDCWVAPGVRVEIAAPGEHWTAAQLATLLVCWEQSRRRQRRARSMAGLLLSAVAIAAAFVVLVVAR